MRPAWRPRSPVLPHATPTSPGSSRDTARRPSGIARPASRRSCTSSSSSRSRSRPRKRRSTGCAPPRTRSNRPASSSSSDAELLAIGFSRQKARYGRALATALVTGALDLDGLDRLDDEAAHRALQAIPGIGPWTSTIYLLMVLGRPDVWPVGDIALAESVGQVKGLGRRPDAGRDGGDRRVVAAVAVGRGSPPVARLPRAPRPIGLSTAGRRTIAACTGVRPRVQPARPAQPHPADRR